MSTRCEIAVPRPGGYDMIYVHYDGYPSSMLPALDKWTRELGIWHLYTVLRAYRELRVFTVDYVEPFASPRDPRFTDILEAVFDYLYVHNDQTQKWEVQT